MKIEYDPAKNARNIEKHGVSFEQVHRFDFNNALEQVDDRFEYGEKRINSLGYLDDRLYMLVYTEREGVARVISFRKANPREQAYYAKAQRI